MQEAQRVKASNKVSLENKFTLKKMQLLDTIQAQVQGVQDELQQSIMKDKSEVINLQAKIISMQKQADLKNEIILEQEYQIRSLLLKIDHLEQNHIEQVKAPIDQDLLQSLEEEISQLKQLCTKLRAKAARLCSYFVCLRLYSSDLGLKIQQDDYDYNLLTMPKLPDHSTLITSLQESERLAKLKLEQQEAKLLEYESECVNLRKENKNMKRCLQKFNVTQNIDNQKQEALIEELQSQLNDQKLLIADLYFKLQVLEFISQQSESNHQCKQLNDFILRKRKPKNQPVFNLELARRKFTLDLKNRDETLRSSIEPRIHSKTINYKY